MTDQTAEEALAELYARNPELAALNPDLRLLDGPETEEDLPWANPSPAPLKGDVQKMHNISLRRESQIQTGKKSGKNAIATTQAQAMSEADLQASVIDLARTLDWRVAHFRPAMTKNGWRTAVAADGAGFPDLVMVRRTRLIVAELKSERGNLSGEQMDWIEAFRRTLTVDQKVCIWRPSDWLSGEIERVLR